MSRTGDIGLWHDLTSQNTMIPERVCSISSYQVGRSLCLGSIKELQPVCASSVSFSGTYVPAHVVVYRVGAIMQTACNHVLYFSRLLADLVVVGGLFV